MLGTLNENKSDNENNHHNSLRPMIDIISVHTNEQRKAHGPSRSHS